jgi:predicted house-cleaning noncanonical NTP pyrophosphatase (MazG superfamily)
MSLTNYVNNIISSTLVNMDKSQQLQAEIHPEINFKYNSINLLISRRGVGKTFSVLKELIKLWQLPDCWGYTTFLYVSDKMNDATVNELINHIELYVRIVENNSLLPVLHDLIDAKSVYQDAINNKLQDQVSEYVKKDLFETLDLKEWTEETPHTAILLDDVINILKDNKFKQQRDLLFQNKQPRLTIFICAQDMFGVPVQIRRNCVTVWIFAGMTDKLVFGMIMNQFGLNFKD